MQRLIDVSRYHSHVPLVFDILVDGNNSSAAAETAMVTYSVQKVFGYSSPIENVLFLRIANYLNIEMLCPQIIRSFPHPSNYTYLRHDKHGYSLVSSSNMKNHFAAVYEHRQTEERIFPEYLLPGGENGEMNTLE